MGLADRFKELKDKAVDATAERSDKIHEVVEKVATTADARTGGKYHERIQSAGAKAGSLVDGIKEQAGSGEQASAPVETDAASAPIDPEGASAPVDADEPS
jgi:MT0933-like antitoxin protein